MLPDLSRLLSGFTHFDTAPATRFVRDALGQVETVLANTPIADVQKGVRAVIKDSAQKVNVATRDDFEVHTKIIERLMTRIEALEKRLKDLEHPIKQ